MEITPWRPVRELSAFRKEMDDLWNRFFGNTPFRQAFSRDWMPSVDVSETRDNVVVRAELPGLETKDIDVSMSGDVLTIKGEKKEEKKKDEHYHCCERYSGSFQRSFRLPVGVQGDKVRATFKDGVLTITLPKAEKAKKKQIEIKTE
ncbi:MAG: Hsp20/alpha crystallin family protein [Desulfobacterales bacterium]|nr:MAG: Hsp20/alpha crystallin family protein [Desulfobacterales bacterium]